MYFWDDLNFLLLAFGADRSPCCSVLRSTAMKCWSTALTAVIGRCRRHWGKRAMFPLITFLPCTSLLITLSQGRTWLSASLLIYVSRLLRQKIQAGWCLTVHFIFGYGRQRRFLARYRKIWFCRFSSFVVPRNGEFCCMLASFRFGLRQGTGRPQRSSWWWPEPFLDRGHRHGQFWMGRLCDIVNDVQKSFFGAASFNFSVQSRLVYWKESARIFLGISTPGNGLVYLWSSLNQAVSKGWKGAFSKGAYCSPVAHSRRVDICVHDLFGCQQAPKTSFAEHHLQADQALYSSWHF